MCILEQGVTWMISEYDGLGDFGGKSSLFYL
jgi:hypothetical protein